MDSPESANSRFPAADSESADQRERAYWDDPRIRLLYALREVPGIYFVHQHYGNSKRGEFKLRFRVQGHESVKDLIPRSFEGVRIEFAPVAMTDADLAADRDRIAAGNLNGDRLPFSAATPSAVDWSLAPEDWDPTPRN